MKYNCLTDLNGEDILDSRDLVELLDELESAYLADDMNADDEDRTELIGALRELKDETDGEGWSDGIAFIHDNHFKTYAEQLADDLGLIDGTASWPMSCINWDQAARELQMDYSCTTIGGTTFWYREA